MAMMSDPQSSIQNSYKSNETGTFSIKNFRALHHRNIIKSAITVYTGHWKLKFRLWISLKFLSCIRNCLIEPDVQTTKDSQQSNSAKSLKILKVHCSFNNFWKEDTQTCLLLSKLSLASTGHSRRTTMIKSSRLYSEKVTWERWIYIFSCFFE